MTEKARRRWVIFFSIVGVLAFAGWIATHPKHHDPYAFLKGQPLLDVGVTGPGSFGPKEHRLYSWHKPMKEVATLAEADLRHYGLKPVHFKGDTSGHINWAGEIVDGGPCGVSSDIWISIVPGRNNSFAGFYDANDKDPEWTTVMISSSLDESWVNIIRYTCFSMRY